MLFRSIYGSIVLTNSARLALDNTFISDLVIKDPSRLIQCNLSNTPLLNKVNNLTMCTRLNLYTLDPWSSTEGTTETLTSTLEPELSTQVTLYAENSEISTFSSTSYKSIVPAVTNLKRRPIYTTLLASTTYSTLSSMVANQTSILEFQFSNSSTSQTVIYLTPKTDNAYKVDSLGIFQVIRIVVNTIVLSVMSSELRKNKWSTPKRRQLSSQI